MGFLFFRLFLVQIDSYTEVQGVIVFRHDVRDVRGSLMQPVLVLGNDDGNRIITPRETTNLRSGWKKRSDFKKIIFHIFS